MTQASVPTRWGAAFHPTVDGAQTTHAPNTLDVTVVLPCYNEQDHVLAELERITQGDGRDRVHATSCSSSTTSRPTTRSRCCRRRCRTTRTCG